VVEVPSLAYLELELVIARLLLVVNWFQKSWIDFFEELKEKVKVEQGK